MFYHVILIGDKKNLCIPSSWVFNVDIVKSFNSGVNRNEKKRIFFSQHSERTPNFLLPLKSEYDANEDGCYLAKIKSAFRSIEEAKSKMEKSRSGMPMVYSKARIETPPCFFNDEAEIADEIIRRNAVRMEIKSEMQGKVADIDISAIPMIDLTSEIFDDAGSIENDLVEMVNSNVQIVFSNEIYKNYICCVLD